MSTSKKMFFWLKRDALNTQNCFSLLLRVCLNLLKQSGGLFIRLTGHNLAKYEYGNGERRRGGERSFSTTNNAQIMFWKPREYIPDNALFLAHLWLA